MSEANPSAPATSKTTPEEAVENPAFPNNQDEGYASDRLAAKPTTTSKAIQTERSEPRSKSRAGVPDIRWGGMPLEANIEFTETDSTSSSVQLVSIFSVSTVARHQDTV